MRPQPPKPDCVLLARSGRYNEVIIRSDDYRDLLPRSVAAVFYTNESHAACAVEAHKLIVDMYKIDAGDVLLLKHTPGGSPGFAMHKESAPKEVSPASQAENAMCPGHTNRAG